MAPIQFGIIMSSSNVPLLTTSPIETIKIFFEQHYQSHYSLVQAYSLENLGI